MITSFSVPTVDKHKQIPSEVIRELAERIAAKFHPQKIILFGSYAYGQPRPESDIDILVLMESDLRENQQALQIRQYLNPLFGMDIIVYSPGKLEKRLAWGDSFLREIIDRGVVLYESPYA